MAPRGPEHVAGLLETRISEASRRHADDARQRLEPAVDANSARWTKIHFLPAAGVRRAPIGLHLATDLHVAVGEKRRIGEGAAGASLAIETGAGVSHLRSGRN